MNNIEQSPPKNIVEILVLWGGSLGDNPRGAALQDLFAHVTALVEGDASIQEGDKVTYDKDRCLAGPM